jgi:hypothetical protein
MNIKKEIEKIQKAIDTLQWAINDLDADYKYYYLLIPDMSVNPIRVQLIRKNNIKDSVIAYTFEFDVFEIYVSRSVTEGFDLEEEFLIKTKAPQAQLTELLAIRKIFGV